MIRTDRIRLALTASAAVLAVIAVALWVAEPNLPTGSVAPGIASPRADSAVSAAGSDAADAGAIVNANIFSATRSAPRGRRNPARNFPEEYSAPATTAEPDGGGMSSGDIFTPPPRLFGTMVGAGRSTALLQADSAGAAGRLYHEGDRVGNYRLVRILSNSVIVTGPRGRLELPIRTKDTERE